MPLEIEPEGTREKAAFRVSLPKTLEGDLRLYQKALGGEERASLNYMIVSALQKFLARDSMKRLGPATAGVCRVALFG